MILRDVAVEKASEQNECQIRYRERALRMKGLREGQSKEKREKGEAQGEKRSEKGLAT